MSLVAHTARRLLVLHILHLKVARISIIQKFDQTLGVEEEIENAQDGEWPGTRWKLQLFLKLKVISLIR